MSCCWKWKSSGHTQKVISAVGFGVIDGYDLCPHLRFSHKTLPPDPGNFTSFAHFPYFSLLLYFLSCMALDTSSKHKFSNLPNTFLENPIKPHLRNGFSIGGSSSKLLSQHNSHHLIGNSHFNIEGSSMNPFSGLQNPLLNRYESLHHHSSGDTSTYGAMGAAPPAATGATGVVKELQSKGLLNCSQGMNQAYWPTIFEESGNTSLVEDFWCITPGNGYEKKVDLKKKKKRRVQKRKASKLRKKLNVVKGQWTPQEDWWILFLLFPFKKKSNFHQILGCFLVDLWWKLCAACWFRWCWTMERRNGLKLLSISMVG